MFGKKSAFEKLLEDFNKLPDEDKAKFKEQLTDVEKAEDEREVDKIEEEKADNVETKDEKTEEVKEESAEIGKEVDEAEETAKDDGKEESTEKADDEPKTETETPTETETEMETETPTEEAVEDAQAVEASKEDERYEAFEARLKALEEAVLNNVIALEDDNVGISGNGKRQGDGVSEDTRLDNLVNKLGGRA